MEEVLTRFPDNKYVMFSKLETYFYGGGVVYDLFGLGSDTETETENWPNL